MRPTALPADLRRLVDTCLLPGFEGTTPPDFLRAALAEGLGGVCLFAKNIAPPDPHTSLGLLTAELRAENPNLLVAIDEEGGDVTRLDARTGSESPGNGALGRRRRRGSHPPDRGHHRRPARGVRGEPQPGARRGREQQPAQSGDRDPLVRRRPGAGRPARGRVRRGHSSPAGWSPAPSTSPVTATPARTPTTSFPWSALTGPGSPRWSCRRSRPRSWPACGRS